MSRKNRRSLSKKQKRKENRKTKRKLKNMEKAGTSCNSRDNVVAVVQKRFRVNIAQTESNSPTDENPTTSQRCIKHSSPKERSRRQIGGNKVYRFKKILDNQARKIVRRSVHLINDNQRTTRLISPKKISPQTKNLKRKINNVRRHLKNRNLKNISNILKDGEISSDIDEYSTSSSTETIRNMENDGGDDDDCIVIEPTLEEITIDDNDDEDFPYTSEVSTNYENLMDALKERVTSTPCAKENCLSNINSPKQLNGIDKSNDGDILPFYVDVGRGTDSINSTDNFTDYTTLSNLRETSTSKRRSVRLRETTFNKVIDLDETSNDDNTVSSLKRQSKEMDDDSVIFISETNKNDFIPLVDDTIPPHKILKISEPSPSTPALKVRTNNLFTQSEKKKLDAYNENTYNPGSSQEFKKGKRMVIIDGSNVAFRHGLDQEFSVKGLQIAIEYFEKMGHEVKVVLPQFRMNKTKSSDPAELFKLNKAGKIVQTPCKNLPGLTSTSYDDRFILQLAFATDAAIVSNDNYRDLIHENPSFKKIIENRVIGYTWCNDIFILPKDPYGKWGPSLETILNRT